MSEKYNGWANHPTWAVNLWISNDEGSYRYWQQKRAQEAWEDAEGHPERLSHQREEAVGRLADWLKDEFEEGNPLNDVNNVYSDLLSSALSDVNWHEIASHYIDDLDKD